MLSQPARNVNTPIEIDSLFDGDARQVNRAERLAMTAAEMIRAAENRWQQEYKYGRRYQGGYGYIEVVIPAEDEQSAPWVHLMPVDWNTYLVRGTGQQYGAPDWVESENMREWLTADRDDHAGIMTEAHP